MRRIQRLLLGVVATAAVIFAAESGYSLFEKGLAKERADADLRGAIKFYEQVVREHSRDRKLAAQALVRMGQCYEKLGDAEARKAYERVVREFGDQKEAVVEAQRYLTKKSGQGEDGSFKAWRILEKEAVFAGPPSRDGRYMPWYDTYYYSDVASHGNLMVRNMKTGELRFITNEKSHWASYVEWAVISPDNTRIAYTFVHDDGSDVFIANLDGTGQRMIWKRETQSDYAYVTGWMPDGKSIVCLIIPDKQPGHLGVINVESGSVRTLAPVQNVRFYASLSPDGRYAAVVTRPERGEQSRQNDNDMVLVDIKTGDQTRLAMSPGDIRYPVFAPDSSAILFVSSRRGGEQDLYAIRLRNGKALGPEEPVKVGMGGATPAGFTADGVLYYSQSTRLQDIYSLSYDAAAGTTPKEPVKIVTRMPGAVRRPKYSPDGKKLLYARGLATSPLTLVVRDLASGEEREIPTDLPSGAMAEWMPDSRRVLLRGKELFFLDVETGTKTLLRMDDKFEGRRIGRVIPTPDPNTLIFSTEHGIGAKVVEYKIDSRATRVLYEAPQSSVFEVNARAVSPDGRWLVVFENESKENWKALMVMPLGGGQPRDLLRERGPFIGSVAWTPDSKDLLVAGTFLGEPLAIWRFPAIEGGQPKRLIKLDTIWTEMSLHPDGRMLVFDSGWSEKSLWAATNVLPAH